MSLKNWGKFILLSLLWGSSFLWIKIAMREIGPFSVVAFRTAFAVLGLMIFVLMGRVVLPFRTHWKVFLILGVINVALPFVLISWSEQYIPSGLASILNSSFPLFTILIAPFFVPDDQFSLSKLIGLLVGFSGVVVLMSHQLGEGVSGYLLGIIAMLFASLSYSIGAVFARMKSRGLSTEAQSFGQLLVAAAIMVPLAAVVEAPFTFPRLPITWIGLIWMGVMGTSFATILFFSLLHSVGPTRTSLVTYFIALIGVILGTIFLGERLDIQSLIGGLLIISGIIIVNTRILGRRHG